jgi:shikimate kinase
MGSGKSTLGKKVARRLGCTFVDTDLEIENRSGYSVSKIFELFGERHFRNLEHTYLKHFTDNFNGLLSCGGGMPTHSNNLAILKRIGTVFYLKRSPKELSQRLIHAKNQRPLLQDFGDDEIEQFIEIELAKRIEFYENAHVILERHEQNVETVLRIIQGIKSNERDKI